MWLLFALFLLFFNTCGVSCHQQPPRGSLCWVKHRSCGFLPRSPLSSAPSCTPSWPRCSSTRLWSRTSPPSSGARASCSARRRASRGSWCSTRCTTREAGPPSPPHLPSSSLNTKQTLVPWHTLSLGSAWRPPTVVVLLHEDRTAERSDIAQKGWVDVTLIPAPNLGSSH